MATRGNSYLQSFSAHMQMAAHWDQVRLDIKDEQAQFLASQKLLQDSSDTLARLEETFRVKQSMDRSAQKILTTQYENDIAFQRGLAGAGAARTAAGRPVEKLLDVYEGPDRDKLSKAQRNDKASRIMQDLARNPNITQEQFDASIARVKSEGGSTTRAEEASKRFLAGGGKRKALSTGAKTPDQLQAEEVTKAALEAILESSEQGFVGGFEGEAGARQRAKNDAPEGTGFGNEEAAYRAYLSLLEDGSASAAELAEARGIDITTDEGMAQANKAFDFASRVYGDAKNTGAFQRGDRKFFEGTWLAQAQRVARLEQSVLEQSQSGAVLDPAREAAKRELISRGLDIDDPFVQHAGTPLHGYLTTADRIFNEVSGDVKPSTKEQAQVAEFIRQSAASGTEWDVNSLAKQLGKTIPANKLEEAVGFGLAFDRKLREGVETPDQGKLQVERAKREKERQKKFLQSEKQFADQVEGQLLDAQAELDELGAALDAELTPSQDALFQQRVLSGRRDGLSLEAATQKAIDTEPDPGTEADLLIEQIEGVEAPIDPDVEAALAGDKGGLVDADEQEDLFATRAAPKAAPAPRAAPAPKSDQRAALEAKLREIASDPDLSPEVKAKAISNVQARLADVASQEDANTLAGRPAPKPAAKPKPAPIIIEPAAPEAPVTGLIPDANGNFDITKLTDDELNAILRGKAQ